MTAGFSAKTARVTGSQLLADPNISKEIQRRTEAELAAAKRKTGMSIERTLREAARLGFSNIGKLFDENNRIKDPKGWDEETAAAVMSFLAERRRHPVA